MHAMAWMAVQRLPIIGMAGELLKYPFSRWVFAKLARFACAGVAFDCSGGAGIALRMPCVCGSAQTAGKMRAQQARARKAPWL